MGTNNKRKTQGFTVLEMVLTVAIVAILTAVVIINVIAYQRGLQQFELNGTAKEIFVAAQNHLVMAESQGLVDQRTDKGSKETSTDDKDVYYFTVTSPSSDERLNTNSNSVLELMLPFASIDESVRTGGGSYVVRYHKPTGSVLDVFYVDGKNFADYQFSDADYDKLLADRGPNKSEDRKHYEGSDGTQDLVIGYFGGVEAEDLRSKGKFAAPTISVRNAERLTVEVTNPSSNLSSHPNLKLMVEGKLSGAQAYYSLISNGSSSASFALPGNSTGTKFEVCLDDITESAGHFADINTAQGQSANKVTLYGTTKFIPGEDLTIYAEVSTNQVIMASAQSTNANVNSLFESITTDEAGNSTARIANIRHLENLSKDISRVGDSTGTKKVYITAAEQTADFLWSDPNWNVSADNLAGSNDLEKTKTYAAGLKGYRERVLASKYLASSTGHTPAGLIAYLTESTDDASSVGKLYVYTVKTTDNSTDPPTTDQRQSYKNTYYPVCPDQAIKYDGHNHSISYVTVNCATDAGLFGQLKDGSEASNLALKDFNVATSAGDAGALVGSMTGTKVSGVLAQNYSKRTNDSALEIKGSTNAGGLVGSMAGGTVNLSAAALYVNATAGNSGGLVGAATGEVTLSNSYAGGHTKDGAYQDVTTGEARVNVQATAAAGGLVGDAASAEVNSWCCYSTCSVLGATAGGFVGTAAAGTISNSYAAGLVSGTGTRGAFAGSVNNTTLDSVRYLEGVTPGVTVVGTGTMAATSTVAGFSANDLGGYLPLETGRNPALAYDLTLVATYQGKYLYPTVTQLNATLDPIADTTVLRVAARHYGDWQASVMLTLNPLVVEDRNEENHYLIVHDSNYATYGENSVVVLTYKGQTSGKSYTRVLLPKDKANSTTNHAAGKGDATSADYQEDTVTIAGGTYGYEINRFCRSYRANDNSERVYYVLIDSITTVPDYDSDGNLQDGHFVNRFPGMIAGENLIVTAEVFALKDGIIIGRNDQPKFVSPDHAQIHKANDTGVTVDYSNADCYPATLSDESINKPNLLTNSIFDRLVDLRTDGTYDAYATNARHLQNLEESISHIGLKSTQATYDAANSNGLIMRCMYVSNNILWESGSGYSTAQYYRNPDYYSSRSAGLPDKKDWNPTTQRIDTNWDPRAFWDQVNGGVTESPSVPTGYTSLNNDAANFSQWQSPDSNGIERQYAYQAMTGTRVNHWQPINTLDADRAGIALRDLGSNGFTINGRNKRMMNLRCATAGGVPAALVGRVPSTRTKVTVTKLFMANPFMVSEGGAAAAYVGEAAFDNDGTNNNPNLTLDITECGTYMLNTVLYRNGSLNLITRAPNMASGRRISSGAGGVAGGVLGRSGCKQLNIKTAFATVPVSAGVVSDAGAAAGGLVGWCDTRMGGANPRGTSSVNITDSYVGGFLPGVDVEDTGKKLTFSYDYHYVNVAAFGTGADVGGLVGWFNPKGASIKNCYSTASVAGNCFAGGLIGRAVTKQSYTFKDIYTTGFVYIPNGTDTSIMSGITPAAGMYLNTTDDAVINDGIFVPATSSSEAGNISVSNVYGPTTVVPAGYTYPQYRLGSSEKDVAAGNGTGSMTTQELTVLGDQANGGIMVTHSYNLFNYDYPYPHVNKLGSNREAFTGATANAIANNPTSNNMNTHFGDWPEVVSTASEIRFQIVNEEQLYVIVTDEGYEGPLTSQLAAGMNSCVISQNATTATNYGANGVMKLTYETIGTNGSAKTFTRELHPEYASNVVDRNKYENGQYCKAFLQKYTVDGETKYRMTYYVLIDSVTADNTVNGSLSSNDNGNLIKRFPGILVGADMKITANVHSSRRTRSQVSESFNTLFASVVANSNGDGMFIAHITNGRHLQNLATLVSGLNNQNGALKVNHVSIDADIEWEEVYGRDGVTPETFTGAGGIGIASFWENVSSCVIDRLPVMAPVEFVNSFTNWWKRQDGTQGIHYCDKANTNVDKSFVPISLLDQSVTTTNVYSFTVDGNNHRLINLTMGGAVARKHNSSGGAGLFGRTGKHEIDLTSDEFLQLSIKNLYLVNPSIALGGIDGQDAGAFVGTLGCCKLTMENCGAYMSSSDQYWMGSTNLLIGDVNAPAGRRIYSRKGVAGGLIGQVRGALDMHDCFASIPVFSGVAENSDGSAGGMIGVISSYNAVNERMISIKNSYVGGYIADNTGAYSPASVGVAGLARNYSVVGGFVGRVDNKNEGGFEIENCYTTASVGGYTNVGGFAGRVDGAAKLKMTDCFCLGAVYLDATKSDGGLFAVQKGDATVSALAASYEKCFAYGAASTIDPSITAYKCPASSLGKAGDGDLIPYDPTVVNLDYLEQDRVSDARERKNERVNATWTRGYQSLYSNYAYRAVTKAGTGLESPTGITSSSRAQYAHFGDWPAVVNRVTLEDVNAENHYLVVTDYDYSAANTNWHTDGLITLTYTMKRATPDAEGNTTVTYTRELHPEAWTTDSYNGKIYKRQNNTRDAANYVDCGFEAAEYCKVYDTVEDGKVVRRYYVLIDSITSAPYRYMNGHAYDRFPKIAPGSDIEITASLMVNGSLVEQASLSTNSLFAKIEKNEDGSNTYTAHIANARQLQNLQPNVSGLDNKNDVLKVTQVELDDDIMWEEVFDSNNVLETFTRKNGERIRPFWEMVTACIPQDARAHAGENLSRHQNDPSYTFDNWTYAYVYRNVLEDNRITNEHYKQRQKSFIPIQLLNPSKDVTDVPSFILDGKDHRLINFTIGGQAATEGAEGDNCHAALFQQPGVGDRYNGSAVTSAQRPSFTLQNLYMVNPNSDDLNNDGSRYKKIFCAPFVAISYSNLTMKNCGVYMSSADQYLMGSTDLTKTQSLDDDRLGRHDTRGRRMFSYAGMASGLIGRVSGSVVLENCFSSVPVYGGMKDQEDNSCAAAGLIASISKCNVSDASITIQNCYVGGYLQPKADVSAGGGSTQSTSQVVYTYSPEYVGIASFAQNGTTVGGLIGNYAKDSHAPLPKLTIENCYSTACIAGDYNVGGLIGKMVTDRANGPDDARQKLINCYSLGSVYCLASSSKKASLFVTVDDGNNDNHLEYLFEGCYALGASNRAATGNTAYTVETSDYKHPTSALGRNKGTYHDDSQIVPFHDEKKDINDENEVVVDEEFLKDKRKNDLDEDTQSVMTFSYSHPLADYPFCAVTDAGINVLSNTGVTMKSDANLVHVGDWPIVSDVDDAKVEFVQSNEALVASVSVPVDQIKVLTDFSVLLHGKKSNTELFFKFALEQTGDAANPLSLAMVNPGTDDGGNAVLIGTTEEEREEWENATKLNLRIEGDRAIVSFLLDSVRYYSGGYERLLVPYGFALGEDLSISMEAGDKSVRVLEAFFNNDAYVSNGKVATANSLFGSRSGNNASVSSMRHLINLNTYATNTDLSGSKPTRIMQTDDITVDDTFGGLDLSDIALYDGGNNTLYGLDINADGPVGFIVSAGRTYSGTEIKNLTLKGAVQSGTNQAGAVIGLAGQRAVTITNVDYTGVVVTGANPNLGLASGVVGEITPGKSNVTIDGVVVVKKGDVQDYDLVQPGSRAVTARELELNSALTDGYSYEWVAGTGSWDGYSFAKGTNPDDAAVPAVYHLAFKDGKVYKFTDGTDDAEADDSTLDILTLEEVTAEAKARGLFAVA